MKELPSEEEEIPFRIKTYKKKELACMYNPNITPRCAIRIFTKWIKINKCGYCLWILSNGSN